MKPTPEQVAEITKRLVDDGKILEAGWIGLMLTAIPENAPAVQISEMRYAFFAGAQHLFSSILTMLDPGSEPTVEDLGRMDSIHEELQRFLVEFKDKYGIK